MTGPADRAVEVLRRRGDGRWTVGSGYLAGGRLVLTAAHNVRSEGGIDDVILVRCLDGSELSAVVLAAGLPPGVRPSVPSIPAGAGPAASPSPAVGLTAAASTAPPGALPPVPAGGGSVVPPPPPAELTAAASTAPAGALPAVPAGAASAVVPPPPAELTAAATAPPGVLAPAIAPLPAPAAAAAPPVAELLVPAPAAVLPADLAVLEIAEADAAGLSDVPALRFARVDRAQTAVIARCWAIGYPRWKEQPSAGTGAVPLRDSVQIEGVIAPGSNRRRGLLELRTTSTPRPLPSGALGESQWQGMSGAVVFSDDPELGPLAVGLLIEHHLPEGASTLTLTPLSDLTALVEGTDWGWRLGLDTWTVLPRAGTPPTPSATGHLALRRPLSDFTDRERLAAQAQTLLTDRLAQTTPVVVLYGMPGVGKTALANHIAHRLAPTFSHARILVDLGGSGTTEVTPDGAMIQALQGFGLFGNDLPRETRQRRYVLHRLLRAGPSLLVLDNVVRASQIQPLLPESPGSAVILTSRSALTSVEGADRLPVAPLADPDGLRLLERITGAERVSRERDAARTIVSLLGGLPLAIRIAATSAASPAGQHRPLSFHAAQLADEQALVSHLDGEDKSVRSSFEISYRGLRPDTARLFRHLGLLAASDFAPALAARACDVTPDHAERMLGELADRQLVEVSGSAGDRYRLHDLLRHYARERAESDESPADRRRAFRRSLRWYADCLETWMSLPDAHERPPAEAVAWFADEFLNVNASMRAAFVDEQWDLLLRIAGSLYGLLFYRGHWEEMESIKGMAVEAARREHDEPAELGSLIHLAEARRILGRSQDTPPLYDRAQEIAQSLGDDTKRAWILTHFGDLQCDLDRPQDALPHYAEADALYRGLHDEGGQIWVAAHIADAHRQLAQPAEAARVLEEALLLAQRRDDAPNIAWCQWHLALAYDELGRYADAERTITGAIAFHRAAADEGGLTTMLTALGEILLHAGRDALAREALTEALTLARTMNAPRRESAIQSILSRLTS